MLSSRKLVNACEALKYIFEQISNTQSLCACVCKDGRSTCVFNVEDVMHTAADLARVVSLAAACRHTFHSPRGVLRVVTVVVIVVVVVVVVVGGGVGGWGARRGGVLLRDIICFV